MRPRVDHPIYFWFSVFAVALVCFLGPEHSVAQTDPTNTVTKSDTPKINQNPLYAKIELDREQILAGQNIELRLKLSLAKDHFAYKNKFSIEIIEPSGVKASALEISPIVSFFDTHSGETKMGVKGDATARTRIEFPADMKAGAQKLKLLLGYQACTETYCLLVKKLSVQTDFTSLGEAKGSPSLFEKISNTAAVQGLEGKPSTGSTGPEEKGRFQKYLEKGWFWAFLFVFFAGVLTSFTPCIFPMIPITLAILGTKGKGQSTSRGFFLSLAYVLGIALTYSVLGVIAASTGSLFGSLLGHPLAAGGIALVFVVMGLSMYGLFEIKAPDAIMQKFGTQKTESSFSAAFVSGLVAGIVASPCVGPVLVGVLTYVAQTQNLVLGFFLLFTFAMGLGQLFLVLGTFSQLTQKLPKAGGWMEATKYIFGTTMMAMALYYVQPAVSERIFAGISAVVLIIISVITGAFTSTSTGGLYSKFKRAIALLVFMIGGLFAAQTVFWSQWKAISQLSPKAEKVGFWTMYDEAILSKARAEGQPVIIDLYADWCGACKDLEKNTFSHPEVQKATADYLWLKFDGTKPSDKWTELQERYKVKGLPTIIFYDRQGKYRPDLTLTGFEDKEEFLNRISRL